MTLPFGMTLPFVPQPGQDPRLFPITDPIGLRSAVVPLIELSSAGDWFEGLGTAFRIDPFNTFLSAQHVVEHRAQKAVGTNSVIVAVLSFGLAYGRPPLPRDCLCTIPEAEAFRRQLNDPLAELQGRQESQNAFDCVRLHLDPTNRRLQRDKIVLPLRLGGPGLNVGDRVLAVGFPKLALAIREDVKNVLTYSEQMFGAIAEISALFPTGRDRTRVWPSFEVRGHWPPGMSGGPIFDEHGQVVGLVSSGMGPSDGEDGTGYGLWFAPAQGIDTWLRARSGERR